MLLTADVYCYFTKTALFITLFAMIIWVCSLNSMYIPSFVLSGCCDDSELLCSLMSLFLKKTTMSMYSDILTCLLRGSYGYLSVRQVLILNCVWLIIETRDARAT